MAKDEDEIVVPKKKIAKGSSSLGASAAGGGSSATSATRATPQMRRLMRITAGIGIALGGFVTLVAVMAVVGLAVDNIWARLVVGLIAVVGLPSFLADRMLKRGGSTLATRGGIGMVADVFAIVLLGAALMLIAADSVTSSLFRHEGDLYAKHGSTTMARAVYFVAGVSPVFPAEKPATGPGSSASASAGASASAKPATPPAK
ncbi:MAG: hypothetical protein JWO86_294 [Myxococcaceae bacterium]|nr:hypothetical protein [Myxococcaceae bacterium]MEA2749947.1 hypothetical protein [Myxococcales bacterium]